MRISCLPQAVVAALVLAAALLPVDIAAAERAGTVVAIRGNVEVTRADGSTAELTMKDAIQQKDVIRTGPRGRVQILFSDETILSLGRNTQIEISECVFDRSTQQGALRLSIREGAFRIVGGAILKVAPENFAAETPTATIGVRGSTLGAEVTAALTRVVLLGTTGGGIVVSNDDGYRIVYIPGTGVVVRAGEAPGPVVDMDDLAKRLLGLTAVGGAPDRELPEIPENLPPLDDQPPLPPRMDPVPGDEPEGAGIDAFETIRGYHTYEEAEEVLGAKLIRGNFHMPYGNVVGLDLTYGWALRTLDLEEAWFTVGIAETRLTHVVEGSMILHAEGTGDSADTFPEGPVSAPPIPFAIEDGVILGNPAIAVLESRIEPPDEPVDVSNWGWWEMDIADPNKPDNVHRVAGLWQGTALVRTAADWVADALLGKDFVGRYHGEAHCLRNGTDLMSGSSALQLDFRGRAVNGTLDFQADGGPDMQLSGTVNRGGIHGKIDSIGAESTPVSSSMRGFFYGDRAQSLQGAFDAQSSVNRYIGIFDASGDITPAGDGSAPVER